MSIITLGGGIGGTASNSSHQPAGGGGGGGGDDLVLTVGGVSSTNGFIASTIGVLVPNEWMSTVITVMSATNASDAHITFTGGQITDVTSIIWTVPGSPLTDYTMGWYSAAGYYDAGTGGHSVAEATALRNFLSGENGNDITVTLADNS
jgi:hypothetical protein